MPFVVILFGCSLKYSSGRNFALSFDIDVFQLKDIAGKGIQRK